MLKIVFEKLAHFPQLYLQLLLHLIMGMSVEVFAVIDGSIRRSLKAVRIIQTVEVISFSHSLVMKCVLYLF